ncbi:hypothetical protein [Aeromicrobium sp. UC242_57]|uniref:hypothetical protein n=1 Tax=Aeromicrobium sp. UC242_57 TaxID=3374624 RepID=UPI0037B6D346
MVRADAKEGEIMLTSPPIVAKCQGVDLPEGREISVRLVEVDSSGRRIVFAYDGVATT